MAEEILDQVATDGPGPGPGLADEHRAKLDSIVQQMIKNKESDSDIQMVVNDFKQKYSTKQPAIQQPKQEQPAFAIQLSVPTFKANQLAPVTPKQGAVIEQSHPYTYPKVTEDGKLVEGSISRVNLKSKDFSFDAPYDEMKVHKELGPKAREAHARLSAEMLGNDKEYEKKVREFRRDSYTMDDLKKEYAKSKMPWPDLDPDLPRYLREAKQRQYDLPVSPENISDAKTGTIANQAITRSFIKGLNNSSIQKDLATVDKFNDLANDPNGVERVDKVKDVLNRIGKGELVYDPEKKLVIKPLGMTGSLMEGVKNKFKADEEHDFFKNGPSAAIIKELESERNGRDPDNPVPIPRGKLNEFLKSAGEMPILPMVAGVAGTIGGTFIGNPELGTMAATALGAYENRKAQYHSTFKQVYNEMRDQGKSESDALNEARNQAENAQEIGTIIGAAQGYLGGKIANIPINGASFNLGYQNAIGDFLKKNGSDLGKIVLDATAQGGLGASGEIVKNKLAQAAGIKREWDEGAAGAFWGNALMTAGIGAAIKFGRGISKINYKTILSGLTKTIPEEAINSTLQEKVSNGEITQSAADQALNEINQYKAKDAQIPANVTEEARFKIQDNIDKITELEQRKEATHKSLQGPIKEQIDKLIDDNLALSKETVKEEKPVSELSKEKEKEAIDFAHELVDEGILPDTYGVEVKKDPIKFWQTVAQQAQNRDENWKPLSQPIDEQAVKDNYGETVVDYAKELFPAPEIPEPSKLVSVIQPGEIQQPEVRTIAPREQPKEIKSTKNVSVIMPGEAGAGKVPIEQLGHVEISEHGEDAKTAAGKENGIGPSPLTEEGMKEAKQLGQYITDNNKAKIITSEVERGLQTAEEAAKEAKRITGKDVPIERNELLNTANIGSDEGKPEGTFKENGWFEGKYLPEGAESPDSFKARMEKAYEYVKSLPEDTHVVSHSKVMRALDALSKTEGKWTDETTNIFLKNKELSHAIQEQSTGGILQHPQEGIGTEGGERGGMEPSQQGEVPAGTRTQEEGKTTDKEEVDKLPFTGGEMMGISHGSLRKIADVLGLKQPERGTFLTPEEQIKRGRALLQGGADPEQVAADFHKDGSISADNISVARARYENLLKEVRDAYEKGGVKSDEYKAAKEKADKWQQEVIKPMGTASGAAMSSLQGETDIDTGSFVGLSRAFEERHGKEMTAAQEKEAKELSNKVSQLTKEVDDLKQKLTDTLNKGEGDSGKGKTIKKGADKFAEIIRKGKINRPGSFQMATPGSLIWDKGLEIMAKTIEAGGTVIQAISDGLSHIKQSDWYKSLSDDEQRNAEADFNKYFQNENDLFTRFADKKDNKFSTDDAKDIWDHAKTEYIDKGISFNEMVYGVSKDLGLTPDQVRNAITQPKGAKIISDEMYKKQYYQRQAIQHAKAWVKSSNTPRVIKALKFIPHLFFRLKTFGHGTVGGITHAGMNIFRPSAWQSYWPSFFKQFKFAFGKAADYEKAMQDLENDPEFIKWKRAGLAVDPSEKFDDYQTFDKMLGRLGAAGDRGFNALKVMRLEMAKAEYNRLSAVEKADPGVLKEIATIVNHATGTSKIPVPEAIGTAFFAPRLEASRWSRLITQPAKAIATFTNWKNATLAEKAAAKIVAKRSGEIMATYVAALAANQGILMATGSKQQINFLNPGDPDWLKFKVGDKTLDLSGGMISAIGFVSHLVKLSVESEKALNGKKRSDALFVAMMKYGRGKLSPLGSTVSDFSTQHDYGGNTMPFSSDKPGKFAHKLSWKEYILNQQTPIPVAEAIKDVTTQMKERGMSNPDIDQIMQGVFIGVMSGGTGARIGEDFSVEKKGSSGGAGATGTIPGHKTTKIKHTIPHKIHR